MAENKWFKDDDTAEDDELRSPLIEYDVSASPNDFNVKTLVDFIEQGVIEIPPFQRQYVWDIRRASKLIESLIMGLPIPQLFLYERSRNKFQVIDGQQRLLTVYYFFKQRFPILKMRPSLRRQLMTQAEVPASLLNDNKYFSGFKLSLSSDGENDPPHPLNDKDYSELGSRKTPLDLRTIRAVIIRQAAPKGDTAIYEIFNRLNSGGINLTPQEIRLSLYYSPFMQLLSRINFDERWRTLLGHEEPDIHFKDVEFLLRGIALLAKGAADYKPSMARFLNSFAYEAESFPRETVNFYEMLLESFLNSTADLTNDAFHGQTSQFTVSIFDAVFVAACSKALKRQKPVVKTINPERLRQLKADPKFLEAAQSRTTGTGNVRDRINLAIKHLGA